MTKPYQGYLGHESLWTTCMSMMNINSTKQDVSSITGTCHSVPRCLHPVLGQKKWEAFARRMTEPSMAELGCLHAKEATQIRRWWRAHEMAQQASCFLSSLISEYRPLGPHAGRRKLTPTSCTLTAIQWCIYINTMHTLTYKINKSVIWKLRNGA